jgi:hypothetical protein
MSLNPPRLISEFLLLPAAADAHVLAPPHLIDEAPPSENFYALSGQSFVEKIHGMVPTVHFSAAMDDVLYRRGPCWLIAFFLYTSPEQEPIQGLTMEETMTLHRVQLEVRRATNCGIPGKVCPVCHREGFPNNLDAQTHILTNHAPPTRDYACKKCPRTYATYTKLRRHLKDCGKARKLRTPGEGGDSSSSSSDNSGSSAPAATPSPSPVMEAEVITEEEKRRRPVRREVLALASSLAANLTIIRREDARDIDREERHRRHAERIEQRRALTLVAAANTATTGGESDTPATTTTSGSSSSSAENWGLTALLAAAAAIAERGASAE